MDNTARSGRARTRSLAPAIVPSLIAAALTAGAVSWATPDGNLVVTLAPALAVGLMVFAVAAWRLRSRQ